MTSSPATASTAAVNKAAAKAGVAAAAVSEALPTVIETADLALTVPAKVVLNQRLIVVAAALTGAGLGAGVLYGVNRFRNRNRNKVSIKVVPPTIGDEKTSTLN